jgi:galactose mutarotase-like enzyme
MSKIVEFQGQQVHVIQNGAATAWIAPEHGGRLLRWSAGDQELIRWPEDADWSKINKVRGGNPLLFPFIARHMVDGKLGFWKDGDTVREMPMHGFARDLPFHVINHTNTGILMRLEDNETTRQYYPFSFYFDVKIDLEPDNILRVAFRTTNRSDRPMPYYPGHHFYFNVPKADRSHWKIEIPCSQVAHQNPDGSITFNSMAMIHSNFGDSDLIDRFHILESNRAVRFHHDAGTPRFRIRLDHPESIPWGVLTTWTQAEDSDFYCVEPWVGLPNAIHHQHGLRLLAPGVTEEAICKIEAELSL